jgi:hypothetical protein
MIASTHFFRNLEEYRHTCVHSNGAGGTMVWIVADHEP